MGFDGIFSRSQSYYADYIFEHSGDLISSRYYNSEDFEDGVKNLVTELQNQGFISAQVASTRIDFDKRKENVSIKIILNEGPQTFISNIIFKGVKNVSVSELQDIIGLKPKGSLQLSSLAEASAKIIEYYRSLGYLDVDVVNDPKSMITYFDENKKADLIFEINEGPLITVSSIVLEGNNFTKDFVILRELQFKKGDILTPEKINYSELRLRRLALFDTIEIRTLADAPKEGRRAVLIMVSERNPGKFISGIGADNELTLTVKGYIGTSYRNLFGTGRVINARLGVNNKVKYSFFEKEINFGYVEPFLFSTNNNLRVAASQSTKLYSILADSSSARGEKVFALESLQGDLILERDLGKYSKFIFQLYGFARTKKYEIFDQAPDEPLDIATIGPSLIYDSRDDIFNPKRGTYTGLSIEYSSPRLNSSISVDYLKTVGNFNKYFSFGPFVFAQELKAGYTKNLRSDSTIPPS
ncbi:MAG: BamA/TamA family outer membrane protein [Oligoflexia bacterium]|nr:BamA/TamA family outer membrane protein [Oligoflexia bacterium]